ncbi:P-II family nitrogen regulator [Acidithiobacillus sp.]
MIQPSRVGDVCEVLLVLDVADLTVTEAQGFGRQNGHTMFYPDTGQSID